MNPKIELPPKYYLAHFQELRSALLKQYGPFFHPEHHDFFSAFDALTEDAQCLFLRLVNRKGKYFFKDTLNYSEIGDFNTSLELLFHSGFVRELQSEDWGEIISVLPKARILEILRRRNVSFKSSWSKEKLVEELRPLPYEPLPEIIVQGKIEELQFLLFLFFGKVQDNLALYTLRDLGVRKVTSQRSTFKARFSSREDADSHFFYAKCSFQGDELPPLTTWPLPLNSESLSLREEVLLTLAENHRKNQDYKEALEVLKYSASHPGREKRARMLYQLDLKEECLKELNDILEAPYTDTELFFAEDFLARKFEKKKRSLLTETLRNARKLSIDESYFRQPEMGVQDYLKEKGIDSLFLENYVFCAVFGLLFWEEIFESEKGLRFNEFERLPQELFSKAFYELHETEIQKKLESLSLEYLLQKIEDKNSVPNGIFGWHEDLKDYVTFFISHSNLESVKTIMLHMAKDFMNRSTGFPDLMVLENGTIKFYEIKAEGDVLKDKQLLQMLALQKAGFEVEVLQVEYTFNPHQLYVVVDIETTGGSLPYHRITELGAVKVRNGEIIEEFQSLVNPERHISKEIQDLTGISNEMVKDAPKFAEVMDAFDEFTKDAIFVAHNVSFDYGFIQAEFNKCERRFTRPYICTKVGMKKHYPGLESYSLKNLTAHFQINLLQHHRALCDAQACAGLLFLINKKRALDADFKLEPVDP